MELIDILQEITARYMKGSGMTDLVIGTVSKVGPLEITVESARLILPETVLKLTAAVVEKKIPVLVHTHTVGQSTTDPSLSAITCIEGGVPLPVQGGYIILNRGLVVGDKVLMLRVLSGQNYLVLSRVYGKEE